MDCWLTSKVAHAASEKVLMLCNATPGLWEHSWYMFGIEKGFMGLAANPRLIEAFTERLLEWQMAYWDMALDEVGEHVDLVQLNEDLGTQHGPMMAPGGGFVFGSVHNIQAKVPVENIVALFNAAKEFGRYPIQA